jgi:excisionase family DNA binding protein
LTAADLIREIGSLDPADCPALLAAIAARMASVKSMPAPVETTAGLVDAAQAAAALNIPESWLRSQARQGKLPFVRLGKYVRFDIADVEQALRKRPA